MESYRGIVMESSLILVVFYLGYILFFSRETTFRQNRIYLLIGILLSIILPFVQFPVPVDYQINALIKLKAVEVLGSGKQVLAERSYFCTLLHDIHHFYEKNYLFLFYHNMLSY